MDRKDHRRHRLVATLAPLTLLAAITAGVVNSAAPQAHAATSGPCDIYATGGTPCVAAHSTTRALYGTYNGPLYQVRRSSDNAVRDIAPLAAGDVANATTQDSFCAGTTCLITVIYDQSGRGNHLTQAPPRWVPRPRPGRLRQPRRRHPRAGHPQRPPGVRRLHRSRHRLPQQHDQRHRQG